MLLIFSIMSLASSYIKRTKKQSRIGKTAAVAIGNGCCRLAEYIFIDKYQSPIGNDGAAEEC